MLWTALGSTATVDARDNIGGFGSSVPVYLTTGVKVAGDMTTSPTDAGFWSGVLYATINYDVSGNSISEFSQVYTGSLQNGLKDQTNPLGSTFPRSGSPGFHSVGRAFWIYNNTGFAPFGQVMYAVSEELIVPLPEPSTYAMALAGVACGGFSMWRRRKRA